MKDVIIVMKRLQSGTDLLKAEICFCFCRTVAVVQM